MIFTFGNMNKICVWSSNLLSSEIKKKCFILQGWKQTFESTRQLGEWFADYSRPYTLPLAKSPPNSPLQIKESKTKQTTVQLSFFFFLYDVYQHIA